ncbi:unnamed protein product, partial [Amoebophrya sp. A25]
AKVAKVVFVITGDGIGTNASAVSRFYAALLTEARALAADKRLRYGLVNFICASHRCNRVVMSAVKDEVSSQTLRFFRYLVEDYNEEFSANLNALAPTLAQIGAAHPLAALYGSETVGVGRPVSLMLRDLVKAEEKPVPTRFFLYSPCVKALFCARVIHRLPVEAWKLDTKKEGNMLEDRKERISKFRLWWSKASTATDLKVSTLCLRLTDRLISICCRENATGDLDSGLIATT